MKINGVSPYIRHLIDFRRELKSRTRTNWAKELRGHEILNIANWLQITYEAAEARIKAVLDPKYKYLYLSPFPHKCTIGCLKCEGEVLSKEAAKEPINLDFLYGRNIPKEEE